MPWTNADSARTTTPLGSGLGLGLGLPLGSGAGPLALNNSADRAKSPPRLALARGSSPVARFVSPHAPRPASPRPVDPPAIAIVPEPVVAARPEDAGASHGTADTVASGSDGSAPRVDADPVVAAKAPPPPPPRQEEEKSDEWQAWALVPKTGVSRPCTCTLDAPSGRFSFRVAHPSGKWLDKRRRTEPVSVHAPDECDASGMWHVVVEYRSVRPWYKLSRSRRNKVLSLSTPSRDVAAALAQRLGQVIDARRPAA